MTEQNNNKQVFNKDDAKKALKTLTTFGLQQGTKFANLAGEKMTKWSKQLGQKMDVVKDARSNNVDDEDYGFGGKMTVKSLTKFINHAASDEELGLAMAATVSDMPDGFTPDSVLDSANAKIVFGAGSEPLELGDLKFRLVRLTSDVETMDLLELLPDDEHTDPEDNGVLVLTGLMSFVLQNAFASAPTFTPLNDDQTDQYLATPINFVW